MYIAKNELKNKDRFIILKSDADLLDNFFLKCSGQQLGQSEFFAV